MKIENEIEKTRKRISLLENQNARFKKLLESAVEVTKKSISKTDLQEDDGQFWQDTIKLIENEKLKLQEDLILLSATEDELTLTIKKLETENLELQKKVEVLLQQTKFHEKEMEKMKTEHSEIRFLLSRPDSNAEWFKKILQLDDGLTPNSSCTALVSERQKLQRKIMNLEKKKQELLSAIEDITSPENARQVTSANIKSDLEKALFKAIDEVAKREFDSLHLKVLDLEKERSDLLSQLQAVLDDSRKKIAEEYCKLQMKILEIEKEKLNLALSPKIYTSVTPTESDEQVNHILDAFAIKPKIVLNKAADTEKLQETRKIPTSCTIL